MINNSENNSQVMFSLEDSEGIVEVKQDFDDENADFYIPQRISHGDMRFSRNS